MSHKEKIPSLRNARGLMIHEVQLARSLSMYGLFTRRAYSPDEALFFLDNLKDPDNKRVRDHDDSFGPECQDRGISLGSRAFYCPTPHDPFYWVNHSCAPSAQVRNFGRLESNWAGTWLAFYPHAPLAAQEHVTLDYKLISPPNDGTPDGGPYQMECACGSPECSGTVMGFFQMSREEKMAHFLAGDVMAHVLEWEFLGDETLRYECLSTSPEMYATYLLALESQRSMDEGYSFLR